MFFMEQNREKIISISKRKIPKSFYTAETGIEPIDETIKK